jgi:hypothetical protein
LKDQKNISYHSPPLEYRRKEKLKMREDFGANRAFQKIWGYHHRCSHYYFPVLVLHGQLIVASSPLMY